MRRFYLFILAIIGLAQFTYAQDYNEKEWLMLSEYDYCEQGDALRVLKKNVGNLKIKHLAMTDCQLKEVPEEIFSLLNLETLNLSYNKIEHISESIGQLMNLKELNLENNKLTTLPSSIVNLINIKDGVRLRNNNLRITALYTGTIINGNPKGLEENILYLKKNLRKAAVPIPIPPLIYTITATSGLSVRNKPNLKAQKIGTMPYKLKIAVYEESQNIQTIDGITAPWMRIKAVANGQYMEGWAWGGYLKEYKYEEDYLLRFLNMLDRARYEASNSNITLDTKQIQLLIKNGVDINTPNDDIILPNEEIYMGWTFLEVVAKAGNIQDFRFLLANGADSQGAGTRILKRKDIDLESKKAFFSALQDYGYDLKSEGKDLLVSVIYDFLECGEDFEE